MQIQLPQSLKCFSVALLYAVLGCMLTRTGSFFLWQLYDGSVESWPRFVLYEKILLHALTVLVAGFAARSFRPTWRWGIATAIASAYAFRLSELALYMHRSGKGVAYRDPIWIMLVAPLILGLVSGALLIWRQYRQAVDRPPNATL